MYSIFSLLILSIILLFFLFKIFKNRFNYFLSFLISFFILYIVVNPKLSISAAINGGDIFFKSIFPVMFPFMVCCNFLIYTEGIDLYSKFLGPIISYPLSLSKSCAFPIITSYLCGYPMGAKYCTTLFESKKITHSELERVVNIASNAGPLFLIASVGTTMFGNTTIGYALLIPSYLSSIIVGFLLRKKEDVKFKIKLTPSGNIYSIGEAIKKSIEDAMMTLIALAGYIIIFSVIIGIIKNSHLFELIIYNLSNFLGLSKDLLESLSLGIIELTNGCKLIVDSSISLTTKLCLISFLGSFGGLSIIAQTYSFFSKHSISFKKYISLKFLQGIISSIIMFLICTFLPNSVSVFSNHNIKYNFFTPSIILLSLLILIIIALKIKKIKLN